MSSLRNGDLVVDIETGEPGVIHSVVAHSDPRVMWDRRNDYICKWPRERLKVVGHEETLQEMMERLGVW